MTVSREVVYELPLYSRLRERLAEAPMQIAPAADWHDWLDAQVKKGVSGKELDAARGLLWSDVLDESVRLTKAQLLAKLVQLPTDIVVKLPRKTRPEPLKFEAVNRLWERDEALLGVRDVVNRMLRLVSVNAAYDFQLCCWLISDVLGIQEVWRVLDGNGRPWRSRWLGKQPCPFFASEDEAKRWCEAVVARLTPMRGGRRACAVKWSEWRIKSGEDYREWLVTAPFFLFEERFISTVHFATPQLLMHLRTSVYRDGEDRFLYLEEIQSDYCQRASRSERGGHGVVDDNPFKGEWVALGLRAAVLMACRMGLDGVAVSSGAEQDQVYRSPNRGRAVFYDVQVRKALEKLAKSLRLEQGSVTHKGNSRHWIVLPSFGEDITGARIRRWQISGVPGIENLVFSSREAAMRYAAHHASVVVENVVPMLRLRGDDRQRIYRSGLPVLGSVGTG